MTPAEKIMREALEWIANPYPDKCFRSTEEARAAYVRRAAEALKRADEAMGDAEPTSLQIDESL